MGPPPMRIVFVLDNSASMLCKAATPGIMSALDIAKSTIDQFVTTRSRMVKMCDHYVLVTCDGPETEWNCTTDQFLKQLRLIRASNLASISSALENGVQFVNNHRAVSYENFALGMIPWYIMPALFVVFTDGIRDLSFRNASEFVNNAPYYTDIYRWEYRVHVLAITASGVANIPERVTQLAHLTCGHVKICPTPRIALQFVEQLAVRVAPTVCMRLKSSPTISATISFSIVQDKANWPLPLPYLVSNTTTKLPSIIPIPEIILKPVQTLIDISAIGLPYDRYDVEGGQLSNLMPPNCQQAYCHVRNSLGDESDGKAFAILTAASLFVFPYNFIRLSRLLREHSSIPLTLQQMDSWRVQLMMIPFYYFTALRVAFNRSPHLSHLPPELLNGELGNGVVTPQIKAQIERLTRMQQALLSSSAKSSPISATVLPRPKRGGRPCIRHDPTHEIPMAAMSLYQAKADAKPTFRDPLDFESTGEPLSEDVHFGSRYKKNKSRSRRLSLSVDEADQQVDEVQIPRQRQSVPLQIPDKEGNPQPQYISNLFGSLIVNHWSLSPIFWSFTSLLTLSECDPVFVTSLSHLNTALEAASSHTDLPMLINMCIEQAHKFGNSRMASVIRSMRDQLSNSMSIS